MRTTIVGGAGFIGSHLAEYLLGAGDTVTVLDDFSSGTPQNLKGCRGNPAFTLHEGSSRDGTAVRRVVDGADRVFHLAGASRPEPDRDRPPGSSHTGGQGIRAVLDACLAADTELLLASSGRVAGTAAAERSSGLPSGGPSTQRRDDAVVSSSEEALAYAHWHTDGLKVSIVRLFTVAGPRQTRRYGGIIPELVACALRNDPLLVPGDGRRARCYSYVGDIVPAMARIIAEPAARGLVLDLGGVQEVSDLALAHRTVQLLGSRSRITLVPDGGSPRTAEDTRCGAPDCTLARRLARFNPACSLDTIILKVAKDVLSAAANGVHAAGVPLREPALEG
ncbi:nucleoside-diphosphate sugar epimerase [Arthrobacter pityocampae]|uniref:Nucleoside-diphosphate sugar epimerase n=1 Tax=Arthrobacter pityocampae TaxID=547334 RepID=A0A2S5IZJ5_9MICC|nr:NAD-dependent epimerase/dehydratase family protein [Arthrobacter pityocampae]PPB50012.1 nucleoside-diphosphate sugar epimerase [Arthrobacter pityocampae]